ncbi:outer membrane receptor protein involved in Fe transport [Sinobacterium caligoides]|uniref:Outer membrane receptor protein involved in Fe transport n=2 Tax=Sinobacterium caligoides TaxID=933926 RepID=A0A3N2DMY0_9GAMM|nr:outer membrane receptor protein involved in Fe transport [Sinobacterium caligoides]
MADSLVLEEVIVVGEKRAQSIQDVAGSISAISSSALDELAITDFSQIQEVATGLTMDKADSRKQAIAMRGISVDSNSTGSAPIDVYWNDMAVRTNVAFQALYDIEQVEILKGPQGTLQGNTSPGGAIHLYSKKPEIGATDGRLLQSFSDNGGSNSQFALNLPISSDKLAIRVAGVYDDNEGQEIKNIKNGQKEGHRSSAGRIGVKFQPTDSFDATLTYDYLRSEHEQPEAVFGQLGEGVLPSAAAQAQYLGGKLQALDPSMPGYATMLQNLGLGLVAAQGVLNPAYDRGQYDKEDRIALGDTKVVTSALNRLTTLEMNYEAVGHIFTSVSGKQDNVQDDIRDDSVLGSPPGAPTVANNNNSTYDTKTQEFRVANAEGQFWDYIAGFYYENLKSYTYYDGYYSGVKASSTQIPIETTVKAIFTHNTLHLSDSTALEIGLRYQELERNQRADVYVAPFDLSSAPYLSLLDEQYVNKESDALTGTLRLSQHLSESVMVYGAYNRAYRPGGITITPDQLNDDALLFDEETSDTIELGVKTMLMGGRLQLNGSAYYQVFDGFQAYNESVVYVTGQGAIDNVKGGVSHNGDATVMGLEGDVSFVATDNWYIGGSASYVDATFDSGEQGPCVDASSLDLTDVGSVAMCDIGGNKLAPEPEWSISLNSEYALAVGDLGEYYLRGLYKYQGERQYDLLKDGDIDGYGVLNLYTGLRAVDGQWDVTLWVKNLTDEQRLARSSNYEYVPFLGDVQSEFRKAVMIPGRTVGLSLAYNFEL